MAISYDLDMATPSSALEVARALHSVALVAGLFDTSVTAELTVDEGAVTGHGTWIRVGEETPRPWNAVITDLGFTPAVSVTFRLGKTHDMPSQQDDMIRLVSGLLERIPGDAVLHREFEDIWLLRRDGGLSLNESAELWPVQRLAAVSQPYRRATHVFSGG
jgi:hypothetical protein